MSKVLQLKISLDGINPKIWRRFLVEDSINFYKLHEIIQKIMGWRNYHLWEFKIKNNIITPPDEERYNLAESTIDKLMNSAEFRRMIKEKDLSKDSASLDVDKVNKILKKIENEEKKILLTWKLQSIKQ